MLRTRKIPSEFAGIAVPEWKARASQFPPLPPGFSFRHEYPAAEHIVVESEKPADETDPEHEEAETIDLFASDDSGWLCRGERSDLTRVRLDSDWDGDLHFRIPRV
jgi:hypothetical protein